MRSNRRPLASVPVTCSCNRARFPTSFACCGSTRRETEVSFARTASLPVVAMASQTTMLSKYWVRDKAVRAMNSTGQECFTSRGFLVVLPAFRSRSRQDCGAVCWFVRSLGDFGYVRFRPTAAHPSADDSPSPTRVTSPLAWNSLFVVFGCHTGRCDAA